MTETTDIMMIQMVTESVQPISSGGVSAIERELKDVLFSHPLLTKKPPTKSRMFDIVKLALKPDL